MPPRDARRIGALAIVTSCWLGAFGAGPVLAAEGGSPDLGSIRGRVVDAGGQAVVSATITVVGTGLSAPTAEDGSFLLEGVPVGDHRLVVSGTGISREVDEPVRVTAGETLEVLLEVADFEVPLREVVVTASISILREEPAAAVALDREQIMALPHFGDDLYRAVRVLPGTSGSDISARFSVRGGLHDETLVTLDGQELMEPFHLKDFQGVFSILDPEMIGGVDLTPGGFTSEHGDRMTGVLDMVTRSPSATRTGLGVSLTTAWASSAGLFADGRGSWLASARRGYLDWILNAVEDDDDDGDPPDPRYWDAFGKLTWTPGSRHALSLALLFADDDLLIEEVDDDEEVDAETGYTSSYLWLTHQGVLGSRSFVTTAVYLGDITVERGIVVVDDPVEERFDLRDDRTDRFWGLRQTWDHDLSRRHYLRWGFDLRSYEVEYDYELDALIQDPIDDPRFYAGERVDSFHDRYEGDQYSVFVTDRVRLGDRLTAEVGARYDRQTLTDDDQVSPRVNLLCTVADTGVLRLGWGHFYQSQRPYELRVQFGETGFLPAQRAEQVTLGYETDLGASHVLKVDAYMRRVRNPHPRWETIFDPFHPVPEIATDLARIAPDSVSAHGAEVFLSSRGGNAFDWWFSYAYSSIEEELDGVDTPRSVDQPHAVTASASWRPSPKWSLTWVLAYHTGWPTTAVTARLVQDPGGSGRLSYEIGPFYRERLDDYYRLDFRASRTTRVGARGELTFFIDVQNLTNRDNQRGLAIADPEYRWDPAAGTVVTFPRENWLPIIPSFGVSWEF